ncbi:PH domain-containing protein [Candidatus Woesebacteria bacterium]|nr:PH domain-containing protein [Candidatus Woesebacteria bacterium]
MQRLDPKSFFIFYFSALRKIFILILVSVPVIILVSVPAYIVTSVIDKEYIFVRFLMSYTIAAVCSFSFIPFMWGYLAFLMTSIEVDTRHILIKKGTLLRKVVDLPYSQIQSITILKEPTLEILGLCSIKIDVTDKETYTLSGVNVDQAHYIRSLYLENPEA